MVLGIVLPSVRYCLLVHIFGHIGDVAHDVLVGGAIENLLAPSPGLEEPGSAQQAEMMTDKGGRLPEFLPDVPVE